VEKETSLIYSRYTTE